jgi:hypothetical protein
MSIPVLKILDAVTVTGPGDTYRSGSGRRTIHTFQAIITGTGAITATVLIQSSLDAIHWGTLVTFTLSGNDSDSAIAAAEAPYEYYRVNVTAISGTGCAATMWIGG